MFLETERSESEISRVLNNTTYYNNLAVREEDLLITTLC